LTIYRCPASGQFSKVNIFVETFPTIRLYLIKCVVRLQDHFVSLVNSTTEPVVKEMAMTSCCARAAKARLEDDRVRQGKAGGR
jgi:hypothetical protein